MTLHLRNSLPFRRIRSAALVLAVTLTCSTSFADKPEWAGGGKGDKQEKQEKQDKDQKQERKQNGRQDTAQFEADSGDKKSGKKHRDKQVEVGHYFVDQQRVVVNNYYGSEFRAGRCPPGLAKKNNGCMPPGQAKKYRVGQRLPDSVIYYQVPQSVIYQLGAPPAGHRYVRVASDILLVAVGTSMVVDAIQNLGSY